jgi:hypothetical protein
MEVEINERLKKGYNPFMSLNNPKEYSLFDDACSSYLKYLYKMMEDGLMRIKTYNGYLSFLNRFRAWNAEQHKPVTYMYWEAYKKGKLTHSAKPFPFSLDL